MNPPNGFGIKVYLTLYKLLADQYNVRITGNFEYEGINVDFDTNDPVLSYEEILKRYGKTKSEIERESK